MDLILLQDVTMTVILLVAIVTSRNSRLCVCNAAKKTLNEILACSKICVAVAPGIEAENHTLSGFFCLNSCTNANLMLPRRLRLAIVERANEKSYLYYPQAVMVCLHLP